MAQLSHDNIGRLIELAGDLTKNMSGGSAIPDRSEKALDLRLRCFDKAFKALLKSTVDAMAEQA